MYNTREQLIGEDHADFCTASEYVGQMFTLQ